MNSSVTRLETSFIVIPIADEFINRIRAGGPDDFGRPALAIEAAGGEPVRDQLRRVSPGEHIFLCSYQAVALPSTFAEIGPVYVSVEPGPGTPAWRDELPPGYFRQILALRAYNTANEIIESTLVEPDAAPALIRQCLGRPEVPYLHASFAGHGCLACRFER